eukprot:TRINITY_DN29919_c0_g1_i1.p1 TRINITY_DN29919_c0_g1~~TRINITY_DN29919_c0_g1_i1.p1  ORF type:complete len:384 (+),score=60.80 TRINITY_DN29919_c0_g1_i1:144-1295(+)
MLSAVRRCLHGPVAPRKCEVHYGMPLSLQWARANIYPEIVSYITFSTEAQKPEEKPTEAAKQIFEKIIQSIKSREYPPNNWRDSLIKSCKNREDVKLAFDALDELRIFRSNQMSILENWKESVSLNLVAACVRSNAPDLGLKTLSRRNMYGITPCISSVHYLLRYAESQKDMRFAKDVLKAMETGWITPQSKTAEIVFRICAQTKQWSMMSYYARKFHAKGVKFNLNTYDTWISLAANIGNTQRVWKIQELRLMSNYKHTIASSFACAKAHLLKWEPQEAGDLLFTCNKERATSASITEKFNEELQFLVDVWPAEVIAMRDKSQRKALMTELKDCLRMMFDYLTVKGLDFSIDVEKRYCSKNSKTLDDMLLTRDTKIQVNEMS